METKLPKRVRVEKCANDAWWYFGKFGHEFPVISETESIQGEEWCVDNHGRDSFILKADCTPIYEEEEAREESAPYQKQVGGTHYKGFAIQPAHFIHANGIGFLAGNVIKYVTRYKGKNGRQDLEKAKHYIDLLIAEEYQDHPPTP